MSGAFVVADALRKELRPRRSLPGSANAPTEAAAKRLLARITKVYAEKKAFHPATTHADIFAKGTQSTIEPELGPLRTAAHAFLLAPSIEALLAAPIDTLAVAGDMLRRADSDMGLFGAIAVLRGIEDALRVAVRSTYFRLSAGNGGWTTAVFTVACPDYRETRIESWLDLRHAVCAADAASYEAARGVASKLREGLELHRRACVAWAFPDEPWANEDLAASHREPRSDRGRESLVYLLSAATDLPTIREELGRSPGMLPYHALDLAHVLPPDAMIALCTEALPALLTKPKFGPLLKTPPRAIAQVLACFRTPEAAAVLAPYANNAVLAPIVLGYFRDSPELAGAAPRGAKGAAAIARVSAKKSAASATTQPHGETPPILRDRPWRAGGAKKVAKTAAAAVAIVSMRVEDERVVLPETLPRFVVKDIRDMTDGELADWRARVEKGEFAYIEYDHRRDAAPGLPREYMRVPLEARLWAWNEHAAYLAGSPLALAVDHGLAAIPGFLRREWIRWLGQSEDDGSMLHALLCLVSPRVVPRVARVAARRKKFRKVARAWLVEHARVAALGLVPDAVGPAGEARADAEAALLDLRGAGHEAVVRSVAETYGADASRIVSALLARDPLAIGATPPKRPAFLRVDELPPVAIPAGVLEPEARDALVEMLQLTPLDPPYPGIRLVASACEAASLGALALELIEQWVIGDAPGRHEWMLFAAVHFPSEQGTRRVAALAREWARKDQAKALRACVALAAIGTDVALLHLAHIAETTRFDALRAETAALLFDAASARDLSPEELGDLTVPDAGLDPDGAARFSYGSRQFVVTLDETLRPVVSERVGEKRAAAVARALPRVNKADDPAAAKEARERFDVLRADLEAVADRERRRLERAMTTGRTWTAAFFRERIVGHPLLVHVARRLVWAVRDSSNDAECTFRVAEDSTFADEEDRVMELAADSVVRIAHPARNAGLGSVWSRVFGDYAILQPFEQLARSTHPIEDGERDAMELRRVAGIKAAAKKILGVLESRGFRRDSPGSISVYLRPERATDGAPLSVRVPLSPSIELLDLASCPDPVLGAPTLSDASGRDRPFGALDATSFSELVRDLEALR